MIRAQFTETVGGRAVTFALPLAGLRRLAQHEPKFYALAKRIADRETAALDDVEAVLKAAAPEDAEHVLQEGGFEAATVLALRILILALTDEREAEPGNAAAPPPETTATAQPSSSGHT